MLCAMSDANNNVFNSVPARVLSHSCRLMLGRYLNLEQDLLSSDGFARDYRGLAEQMGFSYDEVRSFQRNANPTMKILDEWTVQPNATIGKLVEFLEHMGRHDVIQDLQPRFENESRAYQQEMERYRESPVQVPEVTSCRAQLSSLDELSILTREDANTGECTLYDAYISYADEDIEFVYHLAKFLEESGFKLFIRSRDLLAGLSEYEINMQLIKERCKRVLIVLTPDFLKCPACEVQASFAAGLGYVERCRKIVPILLKPCEIPLILKFVSRIDFTKPDVADWIWDKLKSSLRDAPSSVFISERRSVQGVGLPPQLESGISTNFANPAITFPPSASYSLISNASSSACITAADTLQHETLNEGPSTTAKQVGSIKQKNKLQNFRFWQTKKSPKKDSNYSSVSVSSSNATSGFHSQSSNTLESMEDQDDSSHDTPV